jgi:hypothetical protein
MRLVRMPSRSGVRGRCAPPRARIHAKSRSCRTPYMPTSSERHRHVRPISSGAQCELFVSSSERERERERERESLMTGNPVVPSGACPPGGVFYSRRYGYPRIGAQDRPTAGGTPAVRESSGGGARDPVSAPALVPPDRPDAPARSCGSRHQSSSHLSRISHVFSDLTSTDDPRTVPRSADSAAGAPGPGPAGARPAAARARPATHGLGGGS